MLVCVHCQRGIYLLVYFKCTITAVNTDQKFRKIEETFKRNHTHTFIILFMFLYLVIIFKQ